MAEFLFDANQGATKGNQWSVQLTTANDDTAVATTLATMIGYQIEALGFPVDSNLRLTSLSGGVLTISMTESVAGNITTVYTICTIAIGV